MRVLVNAFVLLVTYAIALPPLVTAQIQGDVELVIKEGIEAFRKPGLIQERAACANCHAPDGLDLAYIAFNEETIRRRAEPHVGNELTEDDVDKIVALVDALRQKYNITDPVDPLEFRPFQPGGTPLVPGGTVQEKELAFYDQLVQKNFLFAASDILTMEQALAMREEMLSDKADGRHLQIGLELNRWSEDPHRGDLHATIADWLPDLPRLPIDPTEWYALQDAYLADPTDARIVDMVERIEDMTFQHFSGSSNELFDEKFRSVLFAQHFFRNEVAGAASSGLPYEERPFMAFYPVAQADDDTYQDNPWWNVGDFMRHTGLGEDTLPEELYERIAPAESRKAQARGEMPKLRVPWFYVGWTFDQGMKKSGGGSSKNNLEYFSKFIHIDFEEEENSIGFALHHLYVLTRKFVLENYSPDIVKSGYQANKPINTKTPFYRKNTAELDPAYFQPYQRMIENHFRFWLFMIWDDVQKRGLPDEIPGGMTKVIERARESFEAFPSDNYAFNRQLVNATEAMLNGVNVVLPTSTEEETGLPAQFALEGNYPNPFNPSTTVTYTLGHAGPVHLAVYDLSGREIDVLVDRTQPSGRYQVRFDAESLASGVYLSRLVAGGEIHQSKMILVK